MNWNELLETKSIWINLVVYGYLFIFGACLGSFSMLVGFRVPRNETLLGRSHCESCDEKLGAVELIPIFSYLFLKGKCRHCKKNIGWWYPLFEIISGAVFSATFYLWGFSKETIIALTLFILLWMITVSDITSHKIPNNILLPFAIIGLVERLLLAQFHYWWYPFVGMFVGLITLYLLRISHRSKKGMGFGDIKLFAVLGIYLGPILALFSLVAAAIIGIVFTIIVFVSKNKKLKSVPFGPFAGMGAWLIYLLSFVFKWNF
ncbi:MAG: prepilin peptidase [Lactobacillales bacterium]|jgi:leader peptidase (prepilin peptidase)/N-methyltransferase|nr:prepilin peptidase [Lactobacillales bacterium]